MSTVLKSPANITHIKECKKLYRHLNCVTMEDSVYIENQWHHACLSAYNKSPSAENKYLDLKLNLNFEDIQDIINAYGIYPPENHWYWVKLTKTKHMEVFNKIFCENVESGNEKIENKKMSEEDKY